MPKNFDIIVFNISKPEDPILDIQKQLIDAVSTHSVTKLIKIVNGLGENSMDFNFRTKLSGDTLLMQSLIKTPNISLIEHLIHTLKIDVNCPNSNNGNTALHKAVINFDLNPKLYTKIINMLVQNGANLYQQNVDKETPLYIASVKANPETLNLLFVNTEISRTSDFISINKNELKIGKITTKPEGPILDIQKQLIDAVSTHSVTKLIKIVNGSGENSMDFNFRTKLSGDTLLMQSLIKTPNISLIEHLIHTLKIDVNCPNSNNGNTALHKAVINFDLNPKLYTKIINMLVQNGANLYQQNVDKETPLYIASVKANPETLNLLTMFNQPLDAGKESNINFEEIILGGTLDNFKLLIQDGNNYINDRINKQAETLLIIAAKYGRINIIKYLLLQGARINEVDKDNNNFLHHLFSVIDLSQDNSIDVENIVVFSIKNGLKLNTRNVWNKTINDIAKEIKSESLVRLLDEALFQQITCDKQNNNSSYTEGNVENENNYKNSLKFVLNENLLPQDSVDLTGDITMYDL